MKQFTQEIKINTTSAVEFVDITDRVKEFFASSKIKDGLLNIYTVHTTTAIKINERCERLQKDMLSFLERAIPSSDFLHDKSTVDGRENARSHLMSFMLQASETVPVTGGELLLGSWQSVFFVELDGPRKSRTIILKIIGE